MISQPEAATLSFEEWCKQRVERSPQVQFWQLVLKIELDVMTWDRAIHEGNFLLYVDALTNLQCLFHALDHYNYARVTIHLRDMGTLQVKYPDVFKAFCEGKFTVNKTHRPFSRMPQDESHEQNNVCVKEDGEQSALLRSRRH